MFFEYFMIILNLVKPKFDQHLNKFELIWKCAHETSLIHEHETSLIHEHEIYFECFWISYAKPQVHKFFLVLFFEYVKHALATAQMVFFFYSHRLATAERHGPTK